MIPFIQSSKIGKPNIYYLLDINLHSITIKIITLEVRIVIIFGESKNGKLSNSRVVKIFHFLMWVLDN